MLAGLALAHTEPAHVAMDIVVIVAKYIRVAIATIATAATPTATTATRATILDGAMPIVHVGMQTVIAIVKDGSSWMVAYSHYDNAMSSGLVRTKLSETVIVRL
eukprot:SAG11_NODE_308_length_10943_cov_6.679609_9_plen_104_part_00